MTAISITPGYPTFADTDGSPLNDGYVYIGLEYQDPITAPTTAFWDKDFRIPADQPLRTSGGYVVRDGSPAAVYTGAAYSILVQNKNLVTVYNAPSAVITNVTNDVEIITQYQGAHATDPIARNDGTPLQTGDLYFNTVVNELKVWTGTVWVPAVPGTVTVENFTGTGAQTAFNLATAPVAENNTQIYIDGVYQQKDTYTLSGATINFSAAPPLNSTIEVVTFSISSLGTTDASNVSYNEGGTGAVNRSVQDKLQESVSVLDFGAASGSDITTAFLAAAKYCSANLRRMFIPYGIYTISGGIDGVADSVSYLEMEFETDATIRFDDSGGGFDWLKDISTLIIRGGYIGASGYEISGDYGTIRYTQNAAELWLEDVDFNGGSLQQHCVFSATDIGPTKLTVTKCDFRNFLHEAFELYAETSGTSESQYIIQDSYFKNMGTLLQAITVRAILLGSNDSRLDNVVVKNCKIDGVYCGNGPANGILLYGNSVVVDGNYVKDVINTLGDDAEGIYVKATNARIVNNYVLNGGNSHDGSINIKGSSVVGSDEEAGYSIIANNCVELTNTTIDVPGITVNRSHVICTNNVLTDLRANRGTKTIGTALGIGTSEPVADVIVSNNIITGFKNYFGSLTNYPAQIAHNGLIADNICTLADSGYVMPFRDDAAILSFGPSNGFTFSASAQTVTYDDLNYSFDQYVYRIGDTIEVVGTVSNNGTYTITAIGAHSLTVSSGFVDEASVFNATIYLRSPDGFEVRGNVFSFNTQGAYGFRKFDGSNTKLLQFTNNILENIYYGYRLDSGTPVTVDIRDTIYRDIIDEIYGSISATNVLYYSPNSSGTTGGSASAGAGNQYVELTINGTTYKVLHDGTV
jgi:hypothetical protein